MQDLKKNKRRINHQVNQSASNVKVEETYLNCVEEENEELNRSCGSKVKCDNVCNTKPNNTCNCTCVCECDKKSKCEPCDIEAQECIPNPCGPGCCNPITPSNFCISNSVPYAIEASRIYDTMEFQTFTDAMAPNGEPLTFDYEVIEVCGSVPRGGNVNITINEVCLNYSGIVIDTGCTSLEDYDLQPLDPQTGLACETSFLYAVCGRKNSSCCKKGKGTSVAYKQKGLSVIVEDLVLELRGNCGCTEIVALAYPSVRGVGGQKRQCDDVEFIFNTLSAPICLPSDGRGVTLRQDFQTNLTVDCIGKALLRYIDHDNCECYYDLCIPNDIDLILCLQSVVSTLMNDQIVVLGSPNPIVPRVVDTFNKVCDFSGCAPESKSCQSEKSCGCKPKVNCGCNK